MQADDVPIVAELRARRFVVVDEHNRERAVVEVKEGYVELRLTSEHHADRCEVLVFAGQEETGSLTAGTELWANGNGAGGYSVLVTNEGVEFHRYP